MKLHFDDKTMIEIGRVRERLMAYKNKIQPYPEENRLSSSDLTAIKLVLNKIQDYQTTPPLHLLSETKQRIDLIESEINGLKKGYHTHTTKKGKDVI